MGRCRHGSAPVVMVHFSTHGQHSVDRENICIELAFKVKVISRLERYVSCLQSIELFSLDYQTKLVHVYNQRDVNVSSHSSHHTRGSSQVSDHWRRGSRWWSPAHSSPASL